MLRINMRTFSKKHNRSAVAVLMTAIITMVCATQITVANPKANTPLYNSTPAKYVFYFIGDGMGISQRTAAEKYHKKQLLMNSFPAQGVTTTHSANTLVTDSAAAATALASGRKTNVGMLGMDPDQKPVKSLAHLAKEKGMKVGIITSVSLDHATPAGFYAHVRSRNQYYDIAVALAESDFDLFAGGGLKDSTNKKSSKGDVKDIAVKNGYKIVTNREDFIKLTPDAGKIIAWNTWLQNDAALPYNIDAGESDIKLAEITAKAIEMLDNPKGFFLMVEGGKIDWACHANDVVSAIHDILALDEAVLKAFNFAQKHANETLIIVTADHETGGLTLGSAGTQYDSYFDILDNQKGSFTKFNQEVLEPYQKKNAGKTDFENFKTEITKFFGFKFAGNAATDRMVLNEHEIEQIKAAFNKDKGGSKKETGASAIYSLYGKNETLSTILTRILNNKAGVGWTSNQHTGVPVSTSAFGIGSEIFNGYYDNTDIAYKIMSIMGIPSQVHYAGDDASEMRQAVNF